MNSAGYCTSQCFQVRVDETVTAASIAPAMPPAIMERAGLGFYSCQTEYSSREEPCPVSYRVTLVRRSTDSSIAKFPVDRPAESTVLYCTVGVGAPESRLTSKSNITMGIM